MENQDIGEISKNPKEEKLEGIRKNLRETIDSAGYDIDEGIFETVTILNALDISTSQSCEGHLDHGIPRPWISIQVKEPEERFNDQNKIIGEVAQKYNLTFDDVKFCSDETAYVEALKRFSQNGETKDQKKFRVENQILQKRIEGYLEEFYRNKDVPEDLKLAVYEGGEGNFRICSGAEKVDWVKSIKDFSDDDKKKAEENLPKYSQEMQNFTRFLKDKYLQSA